MTYFGVVNTDGCPFCCATICQLTPTPTPQYDSQGREIFVRSQGRFLFVVEGAANSGSGAPDAQGSYVKGSSGVSFVPITHASSRPSTQVLLSRSIGNGSTAVCDIFPPNLGGVPGVGTLPPLDQPYPGDQSVTDVLEDFACRLCMASSPSDACTKNRFGLDAFMNPGSSRQFCYQVPQAAVFPSGDTIVAVQLRDSAGRIGPRREIVVRVLP